MTGVQVDLNLNVTGKEQVDATRVSFEGLNLTQAQAIQLAQADPAARAAMIDALKAQADAAQQAAQKTTTWTEAQQRAAMQMSAMQDQAKRMNDEFDRSNSGLGQLGQTLMSAAGLGVAFGGGVELVGAALEGLKSITAGAVEDFAQVGHSVEMMHQQLGVTVNDAATWQVSAGAFGMSAERMSMTFGMMEQRISQGSKNAVDAMNKLGINVNEFSTADPQKQLDMLSDAIRNTGLSGNELIAVMKNLGGRGALGLISESTQHAQEFRQEIENILGPMDDATANAQRFTEETTKLEAHWLKVKELIFDIADKPLEGLMKGVGDFLQHPSKYLIPSNLIAMAAFGGGENKDVGLPAGPYAYGDADVPGNIPTFTTTATKQELAKADREAEQAAKALARAEKELAIAEAEGEGGLQGKIDVLLAKANAEMESAKSTQEAEVIEQRYGDLMAEETTKWNEHIQKIAQDSAMKALNKMHTEAMNEANRETAAVIKGSEEATKAVDAATKSYSAELAKLHPSLQNEVAAIDAEVHAKNDSLEKQIALNPLMSEAAKAEIHYAEAVNSATGELKKRIDAQKAFLQHLSDDAKMADDLAKALTALGVSSDSAFVKLAQSVGIGDAAFEKFSKDVGNVRAQIADVLSTLSSGDPSKMGAGLGGIAGGGIGAAIGGPIGGEIGSAIGSAIGGALGGLFGGKPQWEKDADALGKELGATISESMSKQIEADASKLGISVASAGLVDLDKVMQSTGKTAHDMGGDIQQLMQGIADGTVPAKEGLKTLDTMFGDVTKEAADAGTVGDKLTVSLLKQAQATGELTTSMKAYIKTQQDSEIAGAKLIAQGIDEIMKARGNRFTKGIGDSDWATQGKDAASMFAAGFQADIAQKGIVGALDDMGKQMDDLWNKLKKSGDTAARQMLDPFEQLKNQITGDVRGSLDTMQGMDEVFRGIANSGDLTTQSFAAMERSVAGTANALSEAGVSQKNISTATYDSLKDIVSASQQYGFKLDDNTQKLVAQAKAAGYAFPEGPEQKMLNVLTDIDHLLGGKFKDDSAAAANSTETNFVKAGAQIQASMNKTEQVYDTSTQKIQVIAEKAGRHVTETWLDAGASITTAVQVATPQVGQAFLGMAQVSIDPLRLVAGAVGSIVNGLGQIPGAAALAANGLGGIGAGSGGPPSKLTIPHLATGPTDAWLVSQPTIALIGEAGPELVHRAPSVSSPSIGPVPAGGGGGHISVVVHFAPVITGAGDPRGTAEQLEQQFPHLIVRLNDAIDRRLASRSNT